MDPEQLQQDFNEYIETMGKLFTITTALGTHSNEYINCDPCRKVKVMLVLIGGKEMDSLMKNMGKVVEADMYTQDVNKVRTGITAQTNQSMARFKLIPEMP